MASATDKIRILLIRSWTESLAPLRAALRDGGLDARIIRVDIEPALNAALSRGNIDVVVFDPKTSTISRSVLDACLRDQHMFVRVVELGDLPDVIDELRQILAHRLN